MLPNNAKCEWCGKEFRMKPHYIARKEREGKPITCSRSCGMSLAGYKKSQAKVKSHKDLLLATWKDGYNQAVLDMGGRI